jgi:hypothetical protein
MIAHGRGFGPHVVCRCGSLRCAGIGAPARDDVAMLVALTSGTFREQLQRPRHRRALAAEEARARHTIAWALEHRRPASVLVGLALLEALRNLAPPDLPALEQALEDLDTPITRHDLDRLLAVA